MQSFMRRIPIRVLEQEGNPYLFSSPFEKDAMSETLNSPGHLREGIRRGSLSVQTTICRSGESHLGRTPSHAPRSGEKVSRAYRGLPPVRRRKGNMRSTDGYIPRCRATAAFATDPIRQRKKYPPSQSQEGGEGEGGRGRGCPRSAGEMPPSAKCRKLYIVLKKRGVLEWALTAPASRSGGTEGGRTGGGRGKRGCSWKGEVRRSGEEKRERLREIKKLSLARE